MHTVQPQPDWSKLAPPKCKGGPCKQGRRSCRTPHACRIIAAAVASHTRPPRRRVLWLALIFLAGFWGGLIWWLKS